MYNIRLTRSGNKLNVRHIQRNIKLDHLTKNITVKKTGRTGEKGEQGDKGDQGIQGEIGSPGGNSVTWSSYTSTGTEEPYPRHMHFSGADMYWYGDLPNTTALYLSTFNSDNYNVRGWLESLDANTNDVKGIISIYTPYDKASYAHFNLYSVTDMGNYFILGVDLVAESGNVAAGGTTIVSFTPRGQDAGNSTGDDKYYTQTFTVTDTVTVAHNLNKYPAVTVIDSAGDEVEGAIEYLDNNTLEVTFAAPFSGRITCN